MVRMKWTNPWRAFHAEHIVNTQQNKQKHTTSHTLNMLCCKSPSAHWWNSKEIEIHTKQQLFYSVSLTLQGSQPLLLHPVSNERQGRGGGDLRVHPMKKIQVQILELKLYPASMEEATVLRREATWYKRSLWHECGSTEVSVLRGRSPRADVKIRARQEVVMKMGERRLEDMLWRTLWRAGEGDQAIEGIRQSGRNQRRAAVCSLLTAANVAARMVGDTDGRTQPAKGTEPGS